MINFMKYKMVFLGISGLLVLLALIHIAVRQFSYSVEFVGGSTVVFSTKTASSAAALEKLMGSETQITKSKNSITMTGPITREDVDALLRKAPGSELLTFTRVSGTISKDTIRSTLIALMFAVVIMLLYIGWVFRGWQYGVSAIIALLHDTILLLGVWSVLGAVFHVEFDVLFVTAALTIMSFSVHDTIVIFDKIKEELKLGRFRTVDETINASLMLTIGRSINNSLTIILMLSSLFILGGGAIKWFALALLLGTLFGTYSSPFVATPLLSLFLGRAEKKRA